MTSPGAQPANVPEHVGPYRVTGLWHADEVGVVLDAHDAGERVELVLLAAGPSSDPAARERFRSAASASATRGHGEQGPVVWAALPARSGPSGAQPLLGPVWPDPAGSHLGPDFSPYWKGQPAAYPASPAPLFRTGPNVSWWWWLVALVLAVLVFLLLASCLPDQPPQPQPTGGSPTQGTAPEPSDSSPESGSPTETRSPTETSPTQGGSQSPQPTGGPTGSGTGGTGQQPLPL